MHSFFTCSVCLYGCCSVTSPPSDPLPFCPPVSFWTHPHICLLLPSPPPLFSWLHRSVWHAGGSWGLAHLKGSVPRGSRRALPDKNHIFISPEPQATRRNHNTSWSFRCRSGLSSTSMLPTIKVAPYILRLYWEQTAHLLSGVKCHAYGSKDLPWEVH